jgi:hypothetical protein
MLATGPGRRSWLLVVLATVALYGPAEWWGAPTGSAPDRIRAWGVDDETPLGPLAELSNIRHPRADRNLGYPLLYSFLVDAAYAPYLGYLKVTGRLGGSSPNYPYGLADPVATLRVLTYIAHGVTVLLAALAAIGVFETGRRLLPGKGGGWLVVALFLTAYPFAYYGRTGNVDMPMHAWLAVSLAGLGMVLSEGLSTRAMVVLGIGAGASVATKEAAAGAIAGFGLVVVMLGIRDLGSLGRGRLLRQIGIALAVSLVVLAIGSGLAIEPSRWIAHIRYLTGQVEIIPSEHPTGARYDLAGTLHLASAMARNVVTSLTWAGVAMVVAGVALSLRRRAAVAWLLLPVATQVGFTLFLLRSPQLRYMLPTVLLLIPFAGYAVAAALAARQAPARWLALAAATVALGVNGLRYVDLTHAMLRDSRHDAGAWIAEHVPAGRIDYFGANQKLPPIPAAVATELATPYHGLYQPHPVDEATARGIVDRWRADPPALVVIIPDHTSKPGNVYDASVPPILYQWLQTGEAGMRLAARFETPALIPWIQRPPLDYPSVNPPIELYQPIQR